MYFPIELMLSLKVIALVDLLINVCLYEVNYGGTEVLLREFNKVFLSLISSTIETVAYCHSVHP